MCRENTAPLYVAVIMEPPALPTLGLDSPAGAAPVHAHTQIGATRVRLGPPLLQVTQTTPESLGEFVTRSQNCWPLLRGRAELRRVSQAFSLSERRNRTFWVAQSPELE